MENNEVYTEEERVLLNEKTFDSVFWSTLVKMQRHIIPLINEVFDEDYSRDTVVRLEPMKQVIKKPDKSYKQGEVDSLIAVLSEEGNAASLYHFECQDWGDNGIAVHIAEYAAGAAYANVKATSKGASMTLPHSAVILLRGDTVSDESYTIEVNCPGGRLEYDVPVVRVNNYELSEIIEKELWILLPFYGFRYVKRFKEIEDGSCREEFINDLKNVIDSLDDATKKEELTQNENIELNFYLKRVLQKLTVPYDKTKKGVEEIMGGHIIPTPIDEARWEGERKGREEGMKEGEKKGREEGAAERKALEDKIRSLEAELKKIKTAML